MTLSTMKTQFSLGKAIFDSSLIDYSGMPSTLDSIPGTIGRQGQQK